MTERPPDRLSLTRHRDLVHRAHVVWVRRGILCLLMVPIILALLNVFGQSQGTSSASAPAATLAVDSPSSARGGLLFTASFRIDAHRELKKAILVLDPGWIAGMQVNSINPQPLGEASRDGHIVLDIGHIPAGHWVIYFIEFQIDPTTVGQQTQNVELDNGATKLVTLHRTLTVYP